MSKKIRKIDIRKIFKGGALAIDGDRITSGHWVARIDDCLNAPYLRHCETADCFLGKRAAFATSIRSGLMDKMDARIAARKDDEVQVFESEWAHVVHAGNSPDAIILESTLGPSFKVAINRDYHRELNPCGYCWYAVDAASEIVLRDGAGNVVAVSMPICIDCMDVDKLAGMQEWLDGAKTP